MRNAELFDSRQMTSSRQSPITSATRLGTLLVLLLEAHCWHWSRLPAPSFVIVVPFSSSRDSSASHQMRKLMEFGCGPPSSSPVAALLSALPDEAQNSAPGLPGTMSAITARPTSA